jgi:hypothetical protein
MEKRQALIMRNLGNEKYEGYYAIIISELETADFKIIDT